MQETLVHMLSPTPKTVPQRSHVVAWSVLNLHNTHFLQELLKCNTNDVPARLHICECTKEKAYHCNALLHNNIMTWHCRQSFHKMFSKEIKIGIKKAHGIKAKVFSEMLTVMAPTVNWRLGASSEQAHPLGRGCHGMPMTPMPVSVGSLSSSRSRLFPFVLLGEYTPSVEGGLRFPVCI